MNAHKANRWLTLGANVGVLFGILLLVYELAQNREMIQSQTRSEVSRQVSDRLQLMASDSELASIWRRARDGEELSVDEETQYFLLIQATLRDWENIHYQYRKGLFEDAEFDAEKAAWQRVLSGDQLFHKYWCALRDNFSPDFSAEINESIAAGICEAKNDL